IQAGDTLSIDADHIDNHATLQANTTDIRAKRLTNHTDGIIDGGITRIDAHTLDNHGKLYGNLLLLKTHDFTNRSNAITAARHTLRIGSITLTNDTNGLILSALDLAIGGALDDQDLVTGRLRQLTNRSAQIQAERNLYIAAERIDNLNQRIVTQQVTDPTVLHFD